MTLPNTVVFDLGKVLLDFDYSKVGRRLQAASRLDALTIQKLVDHSPLLFRFETGLMTQQQFFDEVRTDTGFTGNFADFARMFTEIFEPIPRMIELHATLRARGVPTYIFSNTNELQLSHIRRTYPFFANFDGYILSYEQGAMKPNAKIYEVVELVTGRRGAEILYLDDRAENVAAGAARGWQVILQESPEKTLAAMANLGMP